MKPGDHYITNDPWLGTGHLHDLTVVSPAFLRGRIVGLFANTAHVIDVGGLGMGPEGRSVFEEGLYIPIVKCFDQGRANETFFDFLRAGTRTPAELEGDVYSLCACNEAGARRLVEMLDEFGMDGLDPLAEHIFESSRRATLAEIARLPPGTWRAAIHSDGYEAPVTLQAAMTIGAEEIVVDFAGTSPLSGRGINVPPAYCRAYACFGIKCVVAPEVPNNWASLAPFRMEIPEGCILNAPRPYPVSVRHVVGQLLPDLMMGCLHRRRAGAGDGRGLLRAVEPALARRRARERAGGGGRGFRDHHLQLRRHRRAAGRRWARRHRLSLGRPHHAGGGDGERGARDVLAEGAAAGQRGGGAHARRVRTNHGDRRQGRRGVRGERHLRPRGECAHAGATAAATAPRVGSGSTIPTARRFGQKGSRWCRRGGGWC